MTIHATTLADGHVVSDERARLDMGYVHAALRGSYWAADRPRALTERSWAHCLCLGIYRPDGAPRGFCRVLTDYALRAHLADVFVDPQARGLGLGKALVATVLAHPELATVTHWTLTTSDAHGLYRRFGFRTGEADGGWMTLLRAGAPALAVADAAGDGTRAAPGTAPG